MPEFVAFAASGGKGGKNLPGGGNPLPVRGDGGMEMG
ncbi:putative protein OS=Sphingobium scionense OX=1404341 GN=GGQ90_002072 PE=4 SV=1 [Sphingobium scionense]